MTTLSKEEARMLYAKSDLGNAAARLQQAFAERNGEQVAALHAEHCLAMYPQPAPTQGRAAIQQVWTGFFAAADFIHPITIDEMVEAEQGDLGYVFGRWWLIQPSADLRLGGRYVNIWQPRDGRWEVTHVSANTYADVAAEEPPA